MAVGFERTSMDAIASAAGVSKQTVYSHFQNKDELFRNCIDGKIQQYQLGLAASASDLPLREGLIGFGERFLSLLCDPAVIAMWRLVISEAGAHPNIAELFYEAGPKTTIQAIRKLLVRHGELGELEVDDYDYAARLFLAMVRGEHHSRAMLNLIDGIPEETRSAQTARATDQFLKIYAP
jgi:TetR/AcrR family transcriptional repressor of mexJK operon